MRHLTRTKVLIKTIETQIEKNQLRIKRLAKQNYELRKNAEALKRIPKNTPFKKADLEASDKTKRIGKFYDAAFHEEQREAARVVKEEADKKATEEAEAKLTEVSPGGTI